MLCMGVVTGNLQRENTREPLNTFSACVFSNVNTHAVVRGTKKKSILRHYDFFARPGLSSCERGHTVMREKYGELPKYSSNFL